jgi:hypothetical protein
MYFISINRDKFVNSKINLKFIHIPKNAGTSIENLGKLYNYKWGRFDNIKVYKKSSCDYYIWHSPYIIKEKGYEYFCIIRNPYDKIISEFYYVTSNKLLENKFSNKKHIDIFYEWFNNIYEIYKNNKYWNNCHILPQSNYIFDKNRNKIIKYIIVMDKDFNKNLNNLFNKKFNLNIDITKLKKDNSTRKKFNKNDLNIDIRNKIYEMYKSDFKNFNFSK